MGLQKVRHHWATFTLFFPTPYQILLILRTFFFFSGIISFSRNIITLFAYKQFSFLGLYTDNVANFLLNHPCIPEANFPYNVLHIWITTRLIIRNILGIPGGSVVKNIPAMQEMWVWSVGQEDPLEKEMATHSNILTRRSPRTERASGLQYVGSAKCCIWLSE